MTELNSPSVVEAAANQVPSPERQAFVADQIGEAYKMLLTNGGMISHSGRILAHNYNDVRSENLTAEQSGELAENYFLRIRSTRVANVIPEGRRARSPYVYIVRLGTFERMIYEHRRNSYRFYIRTINESGEEVDRTITVNTSLFEALLNYSTRILEAEGIRTPGFPVSKYSEGILKKIIDERDAEKAKQNLS